MCFWLNSMYCNSEQTLYLINDIGPSYPATLEYQYWLGGHPFPNPFCSALGSLAPSVCSLLYKARALWAEGLSCMVPLPFHLLPLTIVLLSGITRQVSPTRQETSENQRSVLLFILCVLSSWHRADAQKLICRIKCLRQFFKYVITTTGSPVSRLFFRFNVLQFSHSS